jgi:3-methyladenine DNA glycosylase AlkD
MSQPASAEAVLQQLKALKNDANIAGMARFGINPRNTLGISVVTLRKLARDIQKDHEVAAALWKSEIHEARILASLVEIPASVTPAQMDAWAADFDSWDICDQCCSNLFVRTPYAHQKAIEWCRDEREFVRRAGFSTIAALAFKDKRAADRDFEPFLECIRSAAEDPRNFVKKAVNWALRQIGKRNINLNRKAIETATQLQQSKSSAARWIAADAIRELTGPAVQARLAARR